jgi:hypothetical protein
MSPAMTDPLAPARRASTTMYILGGLGITCGLCIGGLFRMPLEKMAAQQGRTLPPLPQGVTYEQLTRVATVFAIIAVVVSLLQLIAAANVRRGSPVAIILGMTLTSLVMLYFVFQTVGALQSGQIAEILFRVIPLVAYAVQMTFLAQARRAGPFILQAQAAYQAQYIQHLQQQQAYNGGGYNQNVYNAPATGPAQPGANQTGWQWPAPPPPPPIQPPGGRRNR